MRFSILRTARFALPFLAAAAVAGAWAKDIAVGSNNTSYAAADVQKLASTAVKMGVQEPVNLNLQGGNLTVSGSSSTSCVIKVGSGPAPQLAGISCK